MTDLYDTPRATNKEGHYLIDEVKFNQIKQKILQGDPFQLIPIEKNDDTIPKLLRRSPRGVDCGFVNPLYYTNYKFRNETTLTTNSNHPRQDNFILFEFVEKENKNPIWVMDINTLNIYHEASHFMLSSKFYVDIFGQDFDIQF